jgi:cell division protein FtsI (penicillin-binding protein 3)
MNFQNKDLRNKIFAIFTILVIFIISARYFSIMLLTYSEDENYFYEKSVVERGPILDRNGRVLAIQTRLYSATAWIPSIVNIEQTAEILSEELSMNYAELLEEMKSRSRFMYIKRKISPSETDKIQVYIDDGKLPGITLEPEYGRNYPEKKLASHLIGYTGTDNKGLDGIEYTFDGVLSPVPVNDKGSKSRGKSKEVYGNQVFLTLDMNIQNFAYQASLEAYKKYDADAVMTIAMEADTGEILAYVSVPEIDPNNFSDSTKNERINRPLNFAYEPGSVFKIFSVASAMDLGGIDENSVFNCNGYYELELDNMDPIRIKCLGNHGDVTPETILKYSCNSGAAYAAETISDDAFYQMLKMFDFGTKTNLPLPGESKGLLQNYRGWSVRSKPTMSFGQEISVSAIQMMKAATVFANKGVMLQPHVIKKVLSYDGRLLDEKKREPIRQVLLPETADKILKMMASVSKHDGGTGWRAAVDGINMSVKTGTAQMLDRETGKYSEESFISSCLAVFPQEDPQIILYNVIVNSKKISTYGGVISAPVVGNVADRIVSYLGIPRKGDTVVEHSGRVVLTKPEYITEIGNTIPDFTGLSKKQILPALKDSRLEITIDGEGWVYQQTPPAGTEIEGKMEVLLELK